MPELPWGTLLAGGGWTGMVALAVLSVIRGWLVPASTVSLLLQRVDDWKAIAETQRQVNVTQAEQLAAMLEHMRTTEAVLRSLPTPSAPPPQGPS